MKNLYLLRHAEADYQTNLDDIKRPLNKQGFLSAKLIGRHLKDKEVNIDIILCSVAIRTRQTIKNIIGEYKKNINIIYNNQLYLPSAGELMNIINNQSDKYNSILIVSHNPAIDILSKYLLKSTQINDLQNKYDIFPPCGLIHLSSQINSWQELSLDSCNLEGFVSPNSH